jgi:hypothetical protein
VQLPALGLAWNHRSAGKSGDGTQQLKWTVSAILALTGLWMGLQLLRSRRSSAAGLPEEVLEWLGSVTVDPHQRLVLVRLGTQLLLLSQAGDHVHTLATVSDPDEVRVLREACRAPHCPTHQASARQLALVRSHLAKKV